MFVGVWAGRHAMLVGHGERAWYHFSFCQTSGRGLISQSGFRCLLSVGGGLGVEGFDGCGGSGRGFIS